MNVSTRACAIGPVQIPNLRRCSLPFARNSSTKLPCPLTAPADALRVLSIRVSPTHTEVAKIGDRPPEALRSRRDGVVDGLPLAVSSPYFFHRAPRTKPITPAMARVCIGWSLTDFSTYGLNSFAASWALFPYSRACSVTLPASACALSAAALRYWMRCRRSRRVGLWDR